MWWLIKSKQISSNLPPWLRKSLPYKIYRNSNLSLTIFFLNLWSLNFEVLFLQIQFQLSLIRFLKATMFFGCSCGQLAGNNSSFGFIPIGLFEWVDIFVVPYLNVAAIPIKSTAQMDATLIEEGSSGKRTNWWSYRSCTDRTYHGD